MSFSSAIYLFIAAAAKKLTIILRLKNALIPGASALSADPTIELRFSDETGVEGDPRPRCRWVQPGNGAPCPILVITSVRMLLAAVEPQTGALFSLIFDGVDKNVFQIFLDHMAQAVPKNDRRQLLILDNASWHRSAQLNWHHFEPIFLPAYSPDFNPIKRLRLRLKADWFWDFFARTPGELTSRLCTALTSFVYQPEKTACICSIRK
jgi:hypothetical protein